MKTILPSRLLLLSLRADALVSGAVALLQLSCTQALADLLHLPSPLLMHTGLFLIAYVGLLLVLSRGGGVWSALITLIIVGNVGWALGCITLFESGIVAPTPLGIGFLALQAVTVVVFAVLQSRGLRSSTPRPPAGLAMAR